MKLRVGIAALPLSLRKASGFPCVCFGLRLRLGGVAARMSNVLRKAAEPQPLALPLPLLSVQH